MKMFGGNSSGNNKREEKSISYKHDDIDLFEDEKPKKKKGRGALIVLIIIALLIGSGALYWVITTKPPEIEPPDLGDDPGYEDENLPDGERYYTLLAVGEDQEGLNTDTIMVVRFDTVELTANVVSIPRDTVFNTPDSAKKINSVYYNMSNGGVERLKDVVEEITGFRPNNYITVDIEAFEKIIDAIGGVWFDVPQDMHYTHWNELTGEPFDIDVEAGYKCLNGHDAMGVWRFRQNSDGTGYANGDLQRIEVQHDMMFEIAKQVMNLGLSDWGKLLNVIGIVSDYCETDLSAGNIQWFAAKFLKMDISSLNVKTAPVLGCWINGYTYALLDVDPWLEMVNTYLNPYSSEIKREDCSIVYLAREKELINGQLYLEPSDIEVTGGSEVYRNFMYNNS